MVRSELAKMRRWKETRWGVLYLENEGHARHAGQIENYGTRPGGDIGPYTEDDCEYIARGNRKNRRVVSQVVEHEEIIYDWVQKPIGN